jgi:hypothetical protein
MKQLALAALLLLSSAAVAQTPAGGANVVTGQVSVGTGATQIVAARTGGYGVARISVTIVNGNQAVALCVGPAGVTAATGLCLPAVAGASVTLNTTAPVFGIWSDGSTHNVSYAETF